MDYQAYIIDRVNLIAPLLKFLPHCENGEQRDKIMVEVARIRKEIEMMQEMTKTERKQQVRFAILTIESEMNFEQI
tara:strand:- start:2939 stop:3166 length:228 start_codon:yes stop_codon:yes gene_type:complete